jgi:hypothetical protein
VWALLCPLLLSLPVFAGNSSDLVDLSRLKANPVLREALAVNCPFPRSRGNRSRGASDLYREKWIDAQIEYFTEEIQLRLQETRESLTEARETWTLYAAGEADSEVTNRFREAIRGVENNSKSLGRFIGDRIASLRRRKVRAALPEDQSRLPFAAEIGFLERQFAITENQIRDGFLAPKNIVELKELTDANILERLYLMEQTAKRVRGKLK